MKAPQPPRHIRDLKPYQPGKSVAEIREQFGFERVIKLASNENPLGPSPPALQRIEESLRGLAVYPRAGLDLRKALAEHYQVALDEVTVGNGSEGVLLNTMRAFLQAGDEVVTAEGTFAGFYVMSNAFNLRVKTVPLTEEYAFDLDAIADAIGPETKLVYLANPNNPTGTAFSRDDYLRFLDRLPQELLVVMDEAYFEYAHDSWDEYPDSLAHRHDQVLTLRTFSKAYGLAGVRIGYGIGHPDVVSTLLKVKLPFEPSGLSEAAGIGALEDKEFLTRTLETHRRNMSRLVDELERLGLACTKSVANFVLLPLENPERAEWLSGELLQRGIIARPMIPFRLPHTVRITIGKDDETDVLIEALRDIFKK